MKPIPPDRAFGDEVRAILAAKNLSMYALAESIGYDRAYLSRVVNGKQTPSRALVEAIDAALEAGGALLELAEVLTPDDEDRVNRSVTNPTRVDVAAARSLGEVLAAQRRLDDVLDAAAMIPLTMAQMRATLDLYAHARGAARAALGPVAAEWVQFAGWLYAEARRDERAVRLLTRAEQMADDIGDGVLGAQATNFKGYVARQRGNPQGIVRYFLGAYHTPGASAPQRMGDAAQAAHGYALLGERDAARRLLDEAVGLTEQAGRETPPETAYWLTPDYQLLNLGLAHLALGDAGSAADYLEAGLAGLPVEQRAAEWAREHHAALAEARAAR